MMYLSLSMVSMRGKYRGALCSLTKYQPVSKIATEILFGRTSHAQSGQSVSYKVVLISLYVLTL